MRKIRLIDLDYVLLFVLSVALLVLVTIQVLNRIFPFRGFWTLELLTYTMGAMVWMGVSVAVKENKHIAVENLISIMPPRAKKFFTLLGIGLFMMYLVIIGYFAVEILAKYLERGMATPALRINKAYMRGSMVVGCVWTFLRLVEKFRMISRTQ